MKERKYFDSAGEPLAIIISKPIKSKERSPKVRPEKVAESEMSRRITTHTPGFTIRF
jgi:hypothetical protein